MELRVFTLPTCPSCPMAKAIAFDVAQELNVQYREVSMATPEGRNEGMVYGIMSTPSIAIGDDVVARGRLLSKEKLIEEVMKRLQGSRD